MLHTSFVEVGPLVLEKKIFEGVLYPATLKSAGYYVIPSVQKFAFECPSVRPSVRQSALRFRSLS